MALQNAFDELSLEATQQELLGGALMLLSAILEKMPRVDVNDRLMVNPSESTSPVTVASGTVTTVTTLATLTNQTNIGGRDASHVAYALANAGSVNIYNNLVFGA